MKQESGSNTLSPQIPLPDQQERNAGEEEKVEEVMQLLSGGCINVSEAYNRLLNVFGENETGRVLQVLHRRAKKMIESW